MTAPVTLLVAALGGEGGGVLTSWIVNAAKDSNLPVQATSIPGVAQRTGATTYYIEIWPETWDKVGAEPVLALAPAPGEIDVFASSELLETGRQIQAGYVTPDRTLLIASTHRVFATAEKMKMGDGRSDEKKLVQAAGDRSRSHILFDMEDAARDAGAHISAVLLGAIAGCGSLPIESDTFRQGIRAEGKAIDANLAGFEAGLKAAQGDIAVKDASVADRYENVGRASAMAARAEAEFADSVQPTLQHAVRRLTDFQDAAYAGLYLDRLLSFRDPDTALLAAVAKHLAVRMSFEDVIRVAQAKTRPDRLARIRAETGASGSDTVIVTEFLKPGIAEFCDILPEGIAKRMLARAEKSERLRNWHKGMELNSSSVTGFLKLKTLAGMRRWRRRTWRYRREQESIEAWLGLIEKAMPINRNLALEITECARLIKGYSDTHARGTSNFGRIQAALIGPALAGEIDADGAATAISTAREAALADPEGEALNEALSSSAEPVAATREAAE
ncbi:MAG: indolepyruvate oxidoreductase subunit beta family protein [Alphaproteobacteria bacterium]